jgi:hypothetical protein
VGLIQYCKRNSPLTHRPSEADAVRRNVKKFYSLDDLLFTNVFFFRFVSVLALNSGSKD